MANDSKSTRRSSDRVAANSSLEQRMERRKNRGAGNVADWQTANAELLLQLLSTATRDGTLVTFGYTRDGGAYMVGFFKDGDRFNEYCRPSEDLDLFLRDLANDFSD